jgi:DNA-binding Lrp family transcriptional regulator
VPVYYALVDAMAGREAEVERGLRKEERMIGVIRCKEKNADFMVKFEAPGPAQVDDVVATYVRRIPGVAGVEVIFDWDDHTSAARDARKALG